MTTVPPVSSLVFVVIVAVWAVYLVQHWVRRRDHLATARSVDRFSEAMRVLERRRTLTVPEAAAPRTYAASPLRPARPGAPQVVAKPVRGAHGATAVAPSAALRRARTAAQLRGAGLLAGWLAMVVLVGLAMTGVLPRWGALAGVAACALSVAAVRWSVARQRAARRPARPAARPQARPAPRRAAVVATPHVPVPGQDAQTFTAQSVAISVRTPTRRETARPQAPAAELYDIDSVEAALAPAVPEASQVPDAPQVAAPARAFAEPAEGTWAPVAVPPPTYTLKAKAYRPAPGTTSLPADGTEMALEEEFEDLPRVDRVG